MLYPDILKERIAGGEISRVEALCWLMAQGMRFNLAWRSLDD